MNKACRITAALLGAMLTGCAGLETPKTEDLSQGISPYPKPLRNAVVFPVDFGGHDDESDYGIKQIGIQYTGCLGSCPDFTFIVNSDGTFRYYGDDYVKRKGNWHGTVDDWELHRVLRYIHEIDFFKFADQYTEEVSDGLNIYTMVRTGARKKAVDNYMELGPATLGALEDMICHLQDHAVWKRG